VAKGNVANVAAYRRREKRIEADDIDITAHPLGLTHKRVFDTTPNLKAQWTDNLHSGAYFNEYPEYFAKDVKTLGHTSSDAASYVSLATGMEVLADTAFTIRFLLSESGLSENLADYFALDWGIGDSKWQFLKSSYATALAQLASTWTVEDEATFFTLLQIKQPTEVQAAEIETLRASLYTDYTTLSLKGDKVENVGQYYELTLIPEKSGRVLMYEGDDFLTALECKRILRTRREGVLWGNSLLQIRRSAGHFFWQVGYPEFAALGTIVYPYKVAAAATTIQFSYIRSFEAGVTSVVASDHAIIGDPINAELHITFATTNTRKTPWLYACHARADGGERDNSDVVQLDTDALATSVIRDATPQCEGDMLRSQYSITVGDTDGTTFQNFPLYNSGENRVAHWQINGNSVITEGIIMGATPLNMAKATPNTARSNIAKGESLTQLQLCDKMALLEEYELGEGEIVGDGLYLEEVLCMGLRAIGEKEANLVRIPGHDPNDVWTPVTVKPLPSGIPGETWAIASRGGTRLLPFLTQLFLQRGMGVSFWCARDGKWDIGRRSYPYSATWLANIKTFTNAGDPTEYAAHFLSRHPQRRHLSRPLADIRKHRYAARLQRILQRVHRRGRARCRRQPAGVVGAHRRIDHAGHRHPARPDLYRAAAQIRHGGRYQPAHD
jgi:hypothetical protein